MLQLDRWAQRDTYAVSATPATAGDNGVYLVDATSAPIVFNLPDVTSDNGRFFWVKKTDTSANAVTVTPNGAQTIDGQSSYVLTNQYEMVFLISYGGNWHIDISSHKKNQEMHLVTTGDVTAGYFTLAHTPLFPIAVTVNVDGGPQQVNKKAVGATGATPDFDILSANQLHFKNVVASGLSGHIKKDDILMVEYEY